ncbi:MAG: cytochrome c/FTR1 family iron permease [candidate division WOR-3 bacterium]
MLWLFVGISTERAISILDYIARDYRDVVSNGEVVDTTEWEEITGFAKELKGAGYTFADTLLKLMERKVPYDSLVSYIKSVKTSLGTRLKVSPPIPDLLRGKQLYIKHCSSCHGEDGRSNTPLAQNMDPKPRILYKNEDLSLIGVFQVITYGVEGTPMPSFSNLSEKERWDIAFYVMSLGRKSGDMVFPLSISDMVMLSDAELYEKMKSLGIENPEDHINALRTRPDLYLSQKPKDKLLKYLNLALVLTKGGNFDKAKEVLLDAYFEGFEPLEGILSPQKVKEVELKFNNIREMLDKGDFRAYDEILSLKEEVLKLNGFNPWFAFIGSFGIIFREGLEAILIIAAILAVLYSLGYRREGVYVHIGWISAILIGVILWVVAQVAVKISGASRELVEGISALLASVVLFQVGHWMLANSDAQKWKNYIKSSVKKSLQKTQTFGLFALSFIATFREVFETILFYQALYMQTGERLALVGGFVLGVISLVLIAWSIFFLKKRLPLSQFFAISGGLLLILSFTLVGKGVKAFQEATLLPITHIPWMPSFELLGIYPTVETITAQFLIILGISLVFSIKLYQENTRRKEILNRVFELEREIRDISASIENIRCSIGTCILESQMDKVREALRGMERELVSIEEKLTTFEEVIQGYNSHHV